MTQILVFGDSIVYGAWDKEGGWVARLRKFLDERTLSNTDIYYLIYNLGIDGDTTESLLKRFEQETTPRLLEEETIFIFSLGINDSCFVKSKNVINTPIEKFNGNLQKLIKLARKSASKIVFVGLTPIDETKTTPIPWDTNRSYKNEPIKKYNDIIKKVCKENKILFIEVFEKLINLDYKNCLEDGVHPNSEGHEKIFEIVKGFLTKNKMI